MKIHKKYQRLFRDGLLVVMSVGLALILARSGLIEEWVQSVTHPLVATFVAGFFFTSLFTLAPASVALAAFGEFHSHIYVALIGAGGAVLGDLFLFVFVRDHVSDDIALIFSGRRFARLRRLFRHPFLHWLMPLTGAIIIASPLPDELGLAMMGLSRVPIAAFIPISYTMNFLGILLIEFIAGAAL
ncbi:hypothetical protein A2765_04540 [Candidatus Kaiserbacteria bacterium RIFCSPHIGHO2_01_FULL_56_24]|uniref:Uncharacterized protein n=1 Tax=Candidatus Kaiserbacteria bacterium RIFCSPHIGHO2_01_FULL_56_24 TaxID=1798487 RepID=A0A1F6DES7_9BACT|nr:MAG: hypothetical protein A2765_04540 [Candidatus Kaiserbacteria bacterium RIFCSPHIGHO2_01_FULL_56_24]